MGLAADIAALVPPPPPQAEWGEAQDPPGEVDPSEFGALVSAYIKSNVSPAGAIISIADLPPMALGTGASGLNAMLMAALTAASYNPTVWAAENSPNIVVSATGVGAMGGVSPPDPPVDGPPNQMASGIATAVDGTVITLVGTVPAGGPWGGTGEIELAI
jgi:hypothetical protein